MAALAFCIDTRQQGDLAKAKIVTIITNDQGESEIIDPCHKAMSKKHVSFHLADNQNMLTTAAGAE